MPMLKSLLHSSDGAELTSDDIECLTPAELAQERKALLEERARRLWMSDSPRELAKRIPVSIFAIAITSEVSGCRNGALPSRRRAPGQP